MGLAASWFVGGCYIAERVLKQFVREFSVFGLSSTSSALTWGATNPLTGRQRKRRFDRDPLLVLAFCLKAGRFRQCSVLYKLYEDATLTWLYMKTMTTFDTVTQTNLPARLHGMLVDFAIMRGWQKAERVDLAGVAKKNFARQIAAANAEAENAFKLSRS
jgi:hypothetical protein